MDLKSNLSKMVLSHEGKLYFADIEMVNNGKHWRVYETNIPNLPINKPLPASDSISSYLLSLLGRDVTT